MSIEQHIAVLTRQEQALQFERFDEAIGWRLGCLLHSRALHKAWPLVIEVKRFDRTVFFVSMSGACFDNHEWVRRKANTVQRFLRSSYRIAHELALADMDISQRYHISAADYAYVGGSFPIAVHGTGVIGAVTVSGLPDREDHQIIVDALCELQGHDPAHFALPSLDALLSFR